MFQLSTVPLMFPAKVTITTNVQMCQRLKMVTH